MDRDEDEFYFESDHLAFNGNKDYSKFLKYLLLLECCKARAIKDLEDIRLAKSRARDNPLEFVESLKRGGLDFPGLRSLPPMPSVEWAKYGLEEGHFDAEPEETDAITEDTKDEDGFNVRGRSFDETKPETFNQLWTFEEQRRLEELLREYPEEEIEMHRWTKIARALGNRTPKQVMSRVQKYFLKLHKAGLPIPGRIPKIASKHRTTHQRQISQFMQKKSTFFPERDVPIYMEEVKTEESDAGSAGDRWTTAEMMAEVYKVRKMEESVRGPLPVHHGISCVGCGCENISGVRWTDGVGCDWCSDCLIVCRPPNRLTPINPLLDRDYDDDDGSAE